MSTSITVDSTLAPNAQTIADNLAEAQRHLANHTLTYIDTQNTAGTMTVKTAFELIQDCATAAKVYTKGDPVSTASYFDGKKKKRSDGKKRKATCRDGRRSPKIY
jgi:hypothetical protein